MRSPNPSHSNPFVVLGAYAYGRCDVPGVVQLVGVDRAVVVVALAKSRILVPALRRCGRKCRCVVPLQKQPTTVRALGASQFGTAVDASEPVVDLHLVP